MLSNAASRSRSSLKAAIAMSLSAIALGYPAIANATVIITTATGSGGGGLFIISSSVVTPNPGNGFGGVWTDAGNLLKYNETFGVIAFGGAVFTHVAHLEATEYSVEIDVTNTGSLDWTGYTLYTGAGTLLQPSYLDWFTIGTDAPTITGPGTMNAVNTPVNNNWIEWAGLEVAPGDTVQMRFTFDLIANTTGAWQIQQLPTPVPEPASLIALGVGALALVARRRKLGK